MRKKSLEIFLGVIVTLLCLGVLDNWLQFRNTLYRNGRWTASKLDMEMAGLNGSMEFIVTRVGLHGGALNLGAWHGFQEVLTTDELAPSEVRFDFWLDQSWMTLIFNKDDKTFEGVRISDDPERNSIHLVAASGGQFLHRAELRPKGLRPGWNHFVARTTESGLQLLINGVAVDTLKTRFRASRIGFRGDRRPVWIDNIVIVQADAKPVFRESFGHWGTFWENTLWLVVPVFFIIGFGLARVMGAKFDLVKVIISCGILAVGAWICSALNFYYVSRLYPEDGKVDFPRILRGQFSRRPFSAEKAYEALPSPGVFRILFLGTSQTWGAGAASRNETFVSRVEALLNESGQRQYECVNKGLRGYQSEGILELYEKEWILLRPHLVVVDLSTNDDDTRRFEANLERLVELNEKRGIRTMFVCEPNAFDGKMLIENHEVMKRIGKESNIPVLDIHQQMGLHRDEGFLWWDHVHLTSFGQELLAKKLVPAIRQLESSESKALKAEALRNVSWTTLAAGLDRLSPD